MQHEVIDVYKCTTVQHCEAVLVRESEGELITFVGQGQTMVEAILELMAALKASEKGEIVLAQKAPSSTPPEGLLH